MKRKFFYTAVFVILLISCKGRHGVNFNDYPIQAVPVRNVELTDSFWLPKIKTIQKTTIQYAFNKCRTEGRMDNFLIAGGKMAGPVKGKMPFDDTDLYKIIEGASYSLISNPDSALDAYLDSVIAIIRTGQEPDGYITTWFTIDPANPPAPWVKPSTKRWENEISSHELYNSGHLFEAAAAHYYATGKRNLLDIALKNADLLVENFGPDKIQIVPGHQIVETGLIQLYRITKNDKYLKLSKQFLDWRGDSTTHKLFGPYSQDHLPVTAQDEAVGHAVRAMYMYAAMTDIAAIYGDVAYRNAVMKLWENMTNKKMYVTGGIGARHAGESFGDNYELPNLTAYSETCAAIGSVYWNHRLFLLTGDAKYYDILERTLYNALISGISLDGTAFFYPNPLESDGKYTFNMGSCTRQGWFDCSCCPTNLIRFIPSIPGLIYATCADTLFVNLYASNKARIPFLKSIVEILQETGYPWTGNVKIVINPLKESDFTVKLRIPYWARNKAVPGDLYKYEVDYPVDIVIMVNDEKIQCQPDMEYVSITRKWQKGDRIELSFPMQVKRVVSNPMVKDNLNKVAIEYGPLVFCAEEADNQSVIDNLFITTSGIFQPEFRNDLLGGILVINGEVKTAVGKAVKVAQTDQYPLTLIPYYTWSNRGAGKMKIWLPEEK
jgi:DUF1680 family protein